MLTAEDFYQLADGNQMPKLGLGMYKVTDESTIQTLVAGAYQAGYRLFDTAQMYQNEAMMGRAFQNAGLARQSIFVTTKIAEENQGYDATLRSLESSLKALQMDYVDLLLVHWPLHQHFFDTWRAFERAKAEGMVRSIGVSNYGQIHLQYLATQANEMPVVNQIEVHPYLGQKAIQAYHQENQIVTQAWAPLGRGGELNDPLVQRLATQYGKSPAQIVIRWHLQNGTALIPKSSQVERVQANIDVFDFELAPEDVNALYGLERYTRISQEPELVYERGAQYPH
ncbi:aldo/keto reductase [Weissella diestrammenae]|uniref:Aldo/keto reductase n=1 Tax=Weissella diestrammenae TaxID=1162633 RepID=A0A7G9T483_9LACO|nr:aldo/keto reductase [Weissella diestrammenae]MCM0583435.1 aldo/keto reductase [Weissella diestrammenae]QNN74908.1 aldo/keto reductase [Weissella diestrammenae]